jgi:Ferredoxin-like domain in Api92-like protein
MPNWCNNFIMISGEESNMKPIYDLFNNRITQDETLVMSTLVPENEEFEEIKASGKFLLSPYVEYWGSKWDFRLMECDMAKLEPDDVSFSVCTAWSPPEAFCQILSKNYGVDVTIQFSETGNDFAGSSSYSNGEEEESVTYPYREGMYYLDNEVFWNEVDSDLEWMFCENPSITIDEVLGQMYPFITKEKDIKEITEIYNQYKKDGKTE